MYKMKEIHKSTLENWGCASIWACASNQTYTVCYFLALTLVCTPCTSLRIIVYLYYFLNHHPISPICNSQFPTTSLVKTTTSIFHNKTLHNHLYPNSKSINNTSNWPDILLIYKNNIFSLLRLLYLFLLYLAIDQIWYWNVFVWFFMIHCQHFTFDNTFCSIIGANVRYDFLAKSRESCHKSLSWILEIVHECTLTNFSSLT